ncbi:unnamed protein product [Schistocephalus solidus]|uniref:Fibronectin type-III domain-containing protein n=1 Tax=Schistocephalus solidus TaxID=70667 RepID=A0A183TK66_SCHSO|nr:unnamed protein product [Schistocephalus solidus]
MFDNDLTTMFTWWPELPNLQHRSPPQQSSSVSCASSDGLQCPGLPVPPSKIADNTRVSLSWTSNHIFVSWPGKPTKKSLSPSSRPVFCKTSSTGSLSLRSGTNSSMNPPSSYTFAIDIAQREEAIHAACTLAEVPSPSAFGCHQAPAAIQDSPVDVFAMVQRQSRDISAQTVHWQWGPPRPNPPWSGSPQPPTPWRGPSQPTSLWRSSPQSPRRGNWRQQRGGQTRSQPSSCVHVITAGEEEALG